MGTSPTRVRRSCVRTIPAEPRLSLPLQIDGASGFGRGATADATVEYGALMLRRFPVDWSHAGLDEQDLTGLAELIMRLITSLLQHPAQAGRDDEDLRAWLTRWVAPALRG